MIVLANAQFAIREVAQKKGGVRYAVDQKINPDSIAISLAGENLGALISGFIGTVSKTETSTNLYQDFSIAFFDGFETIKAYKVGPEALARLKTGERLVGNIRQPREYDLLLD